MRLCLPSAQHFAWSFPSRPSIWVTSVLSTLPRWHGGKEFTCQCQRHKRCRFDSWVRKTPWSRKWQPTPIFLSGKSHEQGRLAVYSPWGHKESDRTKHSTIGRYLILLLQGPSCSICDKIKISVMMNLIIQYQQHPKTVYLH